MRHVLVRMGLFSLVYATPDAVQGQADGCECQKTLDFAAVYIERNYAGSPDKLTAATRPAYDELLSRLRSRAATADNEAACDAVLKEYITFFRDHHLSISWQGQSAPGNEDAIRERFAEWPSRSITETELRSALTRNPPRDGDLSGIWEIVGADYRMAMVPGAEPDSWEAVVMEADGVWWTPGQVKGRLRRLPDGGFEAETYLRDHRAERHEARFLNGVLTFSGGGSWARTWPDNPGGYDRVRYNATANETMRIRELDARTMLIQLPTFSSSQAERIDSLVAANWERLTTVPDLIIDVRGNGGGADRSFEPLRPLLYTKPVARIGLEMYVTEDNIRVVADLVRRRGMSERQIDSLITAVRPRLGGYLTESPDTVVLDSVPLLPRRVAVLTDRFCASSCESFVLVALQSDRTTVYGENTGGLLDYGNVAPVATTCPAFRLNVPTARSMHVSERSYDGVGLAPHVRVPDGVVYWLEWVRSQLTAREP